jgi:glycosyltransferase involved in cell wall biosynthesis/GT2 family glycosyltransferase
MAAAFAPLQLGPDDELIAADNSVAGVLLADGLPAPWRVVPARGEGSPARARNAGALHATQQWLLFIDSDCRPAADVIDRYFDDVPPADCGILVGAIDPDLTQESLAARYAASRAVVDQRIGLTAEFLPWGFTANLLVRHEAWRSIGGFLEGIFNGEDVDLCWRAQKLGWTLAECDGARVAHANRESVRGLLKQAAINRASARWLHRRWPEAPLPPIGFGRALARALVGVPGWAVLGRWERARLKVLDGAIALARVAGDVRANRARVRQPPRAGSVAARTLEIWCDEFPVVSETFVVNEARALAALGHPVTVVAGSRPWRPALGIDDVRVRYLEDDTRWERVAATATLVALRPLRCLRDRRAARGWSAEEQPVALRWLATAARRAVAQPDLHLHAHFAAGAALNALRAARLSGRTWSLAAHGYDVFKMPRNLEQKVRAADLVIGPCAYTADELRRIAGPRADHVHEIVMGVDPHQFQRRTPYPGGGVVMAVGRLVEKKGFVDLIRAAAMPQLESLLERVVLIGDGPLRVELEEEAERLGVSDRIEFRGRLEPDEIRAELERAALLAMPCVIAEDGDRDAMPVVVKEALAMEIPVVATDEVGLPELVRPEFGRLVAPHDHEQLARAIAEVLALAPEQRAEMGRAGRTHVMRAANVSIETARLSELLERVGRSARPA